MHRNQHYSQDEYHDRAFDKYTSTSETDIQSSLNTYIFARKAVTCKIMMLDSQKWIDKSNDYKIFWQYVDWKGDIRNKKTLNSPPIQQFEALFEELYKCKNTWELYEIMEIESKVTIPILYEPVTEIEMKSAWKGMKKSGFDYNLSVLSILVTYY